MRYGLGIRMLIAFGVGGLAVLYKIKINPRYKQSEINVAIKAPRRFTFDILTNPKFVPLYFSWVTTLRESKYDKRNMSIGKRYFGIVNLPFLGQHEIQYKVAEMKDFNWATFRPDKPQESYFNTEITFMLSSITDTETHFGMKIAYHRTSALFQITLGRFLRWLTDQQLERVAIAAKNLVHLKWEKFRYPNGRNVTKSSQSIKGDTKSEPLTKAPAPPSNSQGSQKSQDKIPIDSDGIKSEL